MADRLMDAENQQVQFRFIHMECCGHLLCWVNPRMPMFCPECGKRSYPYVKSWVLHTDLEATLRTTGYHKP